MVSSSSKTAGTDSDDATVGTVAWANPGNAAGSCDANVATNTTSHSCNPCVSVLGHYLKFETFGFSIPVGAVILGIQVTVRRKSSDNSNCNNEGGGSTVDNSVKIVKADVIGGTDKKDTSTQWPTTLTDKVYGGVSDLWGLSWVAADINSINFGVAVSQNNRGQGTIPVKNCVNKTMVASIDCVTITVTYRVVKHRKLFLVPQSNVRAGGGKVTEVSSSALIG